jgi:hypothetical protein
LLTLHALLLAVPQVLHAAGQAVAHQLQLPEAEQAGTPEWLAGVGARAREAVHRTAVHRTEDSAGREAWEPVGDDAGELTLEPADLRP